VIADIGAGYGGWTVEMARKVGLTGQVFATEVDPKRLKDIRERVTEAGLTNVTVVWGSQKDTGLPPSCCDAILLRRVYHHFTDPDAMRESIARALGRNGLLAIIDFDPRSWRRPDGIPESRTGHGITKEMLIDEMRIAGFEVVQEADSWPGRDYCIVFRAKSVSDTEP
jgi:ubiquinone/menaquinone biosynthesis C-methylase UbiE